MTYARTINNRKKLSLKKVKKSRIIIKEVIQEDIPILNDNQRLLEKSKGIKQSNPRNKFGGIYELVSLKEIQYTTTTRSRYGYAISHRKRYGIVTIRKDFKKAQLIGKIYTFGKNRYRITRKIS